MYAANCLAAFYPNEEFVKSVLKLVSIGIHSTYLFYHFLIFMSSFLFTIPEKKRLTKVGASQLKTFWNLAVTYLTGCRQSGNCHFCIYRYFTWSIIEFREWENRVSRSLCWTWSCISMCFIHTLVQVLYRKRSNSITILTYLCPQQTFLIDQQSKCFCLNA